MKRLILAGGGHAHLHVLQTLAKQRWPGVEVVLISPYGRQIYSGMLPGWMAGHYRLGQCAAALKPLAEDAGVRFIQEHIVSMDANRRTVLCASSGEISYDLISIDTGALVDVSTLAASGANLLPIRPLEAFIVGWERQLADFLERGEARLAIVGAGAAGVELALASRYRLVNQLGEARVAVSLVEGSGLLAGHGPGVVKRVAHELASSGVQRIAGHAAGAPAGLLFPDGRGCAVDCVIGTTGVIPAPWIASSGLARADDGFIAVENGQRSTSHPEVFSAGDVATRIDSPHAKSGVYAVRAGPVLSNNLQRSLAGQVILSHHPQRRTLYLLATGPKKAIVSWSGWSASGAWAWRWKDWIDRRFVKQYDIA